MIPNRSNEVHVIVDMLYDFIDGTLACSNADEAVAESVRFINSNPDQPVLYICDSHPQNHCSFRQNGGIWPPHCVAGTRGSMIHKSYYTEIIKEEMRPTLSNILTKGESPESEQYSGYEAVTKSGISLSDYLASLGAETVFVSGIATEFCINETAKDLHKAGFKVKVIERALAYVNFEGHIQTLENFRTMGINVV